MDTTAVGEVLSPPIPRQEDDRTGLNKALAFAKAKKATFLIARLDRFSRRVSLIEKIMDEGIQLCCAEMPNASYASGNGPWLGRFRRMAA